MSHAQPRQPSSDESYVGEDRCRNCGAFVTRNFTRVFGNNQNEVFGCLDCMHATEVKNGGARQSR